MTLAETREWALTRLYQDLAIHQLAGHAAVSSRTLTRSGGRNPASVRTNGSSPRA